MSTMTTLFVHLVKIWNNAETDIIDLQRIELGILTLLPMALCYIDCSTEIWNGIPLLLQMAKTFGCSWENKQPWQYVSAEGEKYAAASVDLLPPAELLALLEVDRVLQLLLLLLLLIHPPTNILTSTQYPSFRSDIAVSIHSSLREGRNVFILQYPIWMRWRILSSFKVFREFHPICTYIIDTLSTTLWDLYVTVHFSEHGYTIPS